jgi:hypothetical protein
MTTPIFEFTMMAKDPKNPIIRLTARVVGLERPDAIALIKAKYGEEYTEGYAIAGPRLDS